jgi:hypothetical protein
MKGEWEQSHCIGLLSIKHIVTQKQSFLKTLFGENNLCTLYKLEKKIEA